MPALRKRLARSESWFLNPVEAGDRRRTLAWNTGVVHGMVKMRIGMSLREGRLSFDVALPWIGQPVRGRALERLIPHAALNEEVTLLSTFGKAGEGRGSATCNVPTLLFDAASGRVCSPRPRTLDV